MADRTSAGLFADFFKILADNPSEQNMKHALEIWHKTRGYDFSPYQMYCEEALTKLGLARKRVDPKYPDDGPVWHYGPEGDDGR